MHANLYINYYMDKNPTRMRELNVCVLSNIYNPEIDFVIIFVSEQDRPHLLTLQKDLLRDEEGKFNKKIVVVPIEGRPTYNDYFKLTEEFGADPSNLNIVANKDMIMDVEGLRKLKSFEWKKYCVALSRWDFIDNKLIRGEAVHFNRPDSQDTWIMKGAFPQFEGVNFGLGVAGCDNRIAHELSIKYDVINPSLEIKTYHYHLSAIRNYTNVQGLPIERVPQPYKLIETTMLPNE